MRRSKIVNNHSFRPIFNNKCKTLEVYAYLDEQCGLLIIGYRGGSEYRMNLSSARQLILRERLDVNEDLDLLIKLVREELECVDFEEVTETKQLQ